MTEGVERAAKRRVRPVGFQINISCMAVNQESENTETWQKLHGHAIVAGERLQEKINESVTCLFPHGNVELGQKLQTWFHLDVPVNCCPSHETNLAFPTTEKSRAFAINRASVLGFRTIGGSHNSLNCF